MNFLVDVNPDMKIPEYKMILCKLNEEQIMTITNISNFEYKGEFVGIDELSFEIPLYRMETDGTQIKNERYDAIKGDMLILLNDSKYFYIHYAKEQVSEDGATYKEVQAYSREYELSQKIISGYSGVSRKIYDYTNSKDENGLEIGFFNYIEKICSWRVSYINPNLLEKFRALDFPNSNILQAFQVVQQTFGCVFQFDTINKTIDIYEVDQLGTNQGLHISDKNFLQTLEKTIKSDEIKTRLYLYGRDNISIQKLSITGKPYIDNYDFYKTTDYMSQGLIDALNNYDEYLQTKQGFFDGYLTQLNSKNALLGTKQDELTALSIELKIIQTNLDLAIANGESITTYKAQETAKLNEITTKQTEISNVKNEISTIESSINQIAVDTDMTKHFTEEQARELDPFIREETFMDSNYTEDNLDELLVEGKKILARISQPAIQFSVGVVDFLSVVECQHTWSKFVLGDKVNLYHKDLNFDYEVRLVGYTHNPDSNNLDLKFSNTNTIDDANLYLRDLLEDLKTTSTSVDFSRFKWDKGEQAESLISKYIDSALDLSKQQILKAEGLEPIVDDRGIWLYKVNPDNSIDPKQMRLINNVLTITNDNWNTISTAVSGDGINAEIIRGKLGQFAEIQANQVKTGILKSTDNSSWINLDDGSFNFKDSLKWVNNQLVISGVDTGAKVFNSTPTPPYKLNDLWKVTGVAGVDFKICTIARATGSYVAGDWTNITDSKTYADAIKNLTTGTAISGGITTIDNTKVRVAHSGLGGQYSEMRADGFVRKWQYGEAAYLNDIYAVTNLASDINRSSLTPLTITLPQRFIGRQIEPIIILRSFDTGLMGRFSLSDAVRITRRIKLISEITNINTTAPTPSITILNYLEVTIDDVDDGNLTWYRDIGFDLIVIGY